MQIMQVKARNMRTGGNKKQGEKDRDAVGNGQSRWTRHVVCNDPAKVGETEQRIRMIVVVHIRLRVVLFPLSL